MVFHEVIRPVFCEPWEALDVLTRAFNAKPQITGGIEVGNLFEGAICIKLVDAQNKTVGACLLADEMPVLWVRAAAGRAGVDLCKVLDTILVHVGSKFQEIGFQTRRAGLIKKSQRLGYQVAGTADGFTQMRKKIWKP